MPYESLSQNTHRLLVRRAVLRQWSDGNRVGIREQFDLCDLGVEDIEGDGDGDGGGHQNAGLVAATEDVLHIWGIDRDGSGFQVSSFEFFILTDTCSGQNIERYHSDKPDPPITKKPMCSCSPGEHKIVDCSVVVIRNI